MATKVVKTAKKAAAKKSWQEKFQTRKEPEVKVLDKDFADMSAGSKMLIATPKIVDEYAKQLPKGTTADVPTMRKDLAAEYNADYTCPVTSGIFLRIAAEAAYEQYQSGTPLSKIMPFWRMMDEKSPVAKKLTCGPAFIKEQRKKEGLK